MGAVPSRLRDAGDADSDQQEILANGSAKRRSSVGSSSGDNACPTCRGTGRIRKGQEGKLVAVIPCNDQRLRPRHTKLYVAASVAVCLLVSGLVLFFLFPRAVLLSPVAVNSSFVYFKDNDVLINITNVVNITNNNFAAVQAYNLSVQVLNYLEVVGTVSIENVTSVNPLSTTPYYFLIPVHISDPGYSEYCKKPWPVRVLYLHMQISMTVYYLAHYEQLFTEKYEFIDCGANITVPHPAQSRAR